MINFIKKVKEHTISLNKILLGVISIATVIIAIFQSQIAIEQLNASKLAYSPLFIFNITQIENPSTGNYDDEKLEISNVGFPINNFESTSLVYFKASKIASNNGMAKTVIIPMVYYGISFSNTGGNGVLATHVGKENNKDIVNLIWGVNDLNKQQTLMFYTAEIIRANKITYTDIENIDHVVYFINQRSVPKEIYDEKTKTNINKTYNHGDINTSLITLLLN